MPDYFIIKIRKRLNAGTVPANKEYAAGTLSNVRRCWLAMPLADLQTPARTYLSVQDPPPNPNHLDFVIRYIPLWRSE